jgi:hypothetical protein
MKAGRDFVHVFTVAATATHDFLGEQFLNDLSGPARRSEADYSRSPSY